MNPQSVVDIFISYESESIINCISLTRHQLFQQKSKPRNTCKIWCFARCITIKRDQVPCLIIDHLHDIWIWRWVASLLTLREVLKFTKNIKKLQNFHYINHQSPFAAKHYPTMKLLGLASRIKVPFTKCINKFQLSKRKNKLLETKVSWCWTCTITAISVCLAN